MRRGWLVLGAAGLAAGTWMACVGDVANTPKDSGADVTSDASDGGGGDAKGASLSASPGSVTVVRGGTASTTITLDRQSLAGDVTITVKGAPTGVTATAPAITATTTTLKLDATASATEGPATLTLSATGVPDLTVPLLVAGASGTLDESWDNDGFVIDTTSPTGIFYALAVQPDGSIVAVGSTAFSGGKWLVRRFDPAGKPDATFDTAAATAITANGAARSVQIDANKNRIVIGGGDQGAPSHMIVARLNADGSADQAFANAGVYTANNVDFSQGSNANAIVVRSDSGVVIAGDASAGYPAFIYALDSTGNADGAFVKFQTQNKASLTGLAQLASGAFLATGTDTNASPPAILAVRLTSNGSPDAAFGSGGVRTYASGSRGYNMAVTSGGDALVVGADVFGPSFAETRFAASGTGNLGWTVTFGGGNNAQFHGAAAGPNDSSYAVGWYPATYDSYAIVERRVSDGGLDTTFGDAGGTLKFEDPNTPDTYAFQLYAARQTSDGRLLVAGSRTKGNTGALVMRLWP